MAGTSRTVAMGEGIECTVSADGKSATFKIDLTADLGPSGSGKSTIVAKSGAVAPTVPGTDVKINFTAYRVTKAAPVRLATAS